MADSTNNARVLLVDDETAILQVLNIAVLDVMDCETELLVSGEDALELLANRQFDVIVADMKLPGMTGANLLSEVYKLYPEMTRMIFSARSSLMAPFNSDGSVHQYLIKPNDIEIIGDKIKAIFDLKALLSTGRFADILPQIRLAPSLPKAFIWIEDLLRGHDATPEKIKSILDIQKTTKANLIQIIRSGLFSSKTSSENPVEFASALGPRVVKSFILAIHAFAQWQSQGPQNATFGKLWLHSLKTASLALKIAVASGWEQEEQEDCVIAGLFHDIGKLLLTVNLAESYAKVGQLIREKPLTTHAAEHEIFGITHAEIGAYFLGLWAFRDSVSHICAFHHRLSEYPGQAAKLLAAVHVANVLENETSATEEETHEPIDAAFLEQAGLADAPNAWREICGKA